MRTLDLSEKAVIDNGKSVNLAPGAQPATWADIAYDALMFPSERVMKAAMVADKKRMYTIATRIKQFPKNVSLEQFEIEMMTACVGDKNIPAVLGAFETYLAPPTLKEVKEEQAGER